MHVHGYQRTLCWLAAVSAAVLSVPRCTAAEAPKILLAQDGRTGYTIIRAPDASESEQLAATTLAEYLHKSTGATFRVSTDIDAATPGSRIVVGPNPLARGLCGADTVTSLGQEEFLVRTCATPGSEPNQPAADLVLVGGRPRGTLYGAISFLESEVGVRWLTVYGDESVPERRELSIPGLDRRGSPVFRQRFIYMPCYGAPNLRDRFMLFNRMNGSGNVPGGPAYRPVSPTVHTLFYYINPEAKPNVGYCADRYPDAAGFSETHPEFFSMFSGNRVARQLCFTNPELRRVLTAHVSTRIEQVGKAGVLSISAQDKPGEFCQCSGCRDLVKRHGTPGAPLFAYLADAGRTFAATYPDVHLCTLAYRKDQSEQPPVQLQFPDNTVIRFAPIDDNFAAPLTHPSNAGTLAHLTQWSKLTRHLWVWYYSNPYCRDGGLPIGNLGRLVADFRIFATVGVEGFFIEHDTGVVQSHLLADLQTWVLTRMMWDPGQDAAALLTDFTARFYGPAAPLMRAYIDSLERETQAMRTGLIWAPTAGEYRFLQPENLLTWQGLFDRMEQQVTDMPALLLRVRQARMSLDRASIIFWSRLEQTPGHELKRGAIASRYRETYEQTLEQRVQPRYKNRLEPYVAEFLKIRMQMTALKPLPPALANVPAARIRQSVPVAGSQADEKAAAGIARALETKGELPLTCGFYDLTDKRFAISTKVTCNQIASAGYHLYPIGRTKLNEQCYVWVTASWRIQVPLGEHFDPDHPDREWDLYASMRFEGPSYPHGDKGGVDRVHVDRVVLVVP